MIYIFQSETITTNYELHLSNFLFFSYTYSNEEELTLNIF